MRKNILLTLILAACSSAAFAQSFNAYGDVVSVQPHMSTSIQQNQQCDDVQVQGASTSNERGVSGSIIGGIAGALLGNTVGGGNGRTVATAAGGIGGAIVGDRMQNNQNNQGEQQRTVRQCRNVNNEVVQQNGYDVAYTYDGRRFTTFAQRDPGNRIALTVSVNPR